MYREVFDKITDTFTQGRYATEFNEAREEFFRETGKIFEDEQFFESRNTACIEWYLLDRNLGQAGVPPVRLYFLMNREQLNEEEKSVLVGLEQSIHGLFAFLGRDNDTYCIKDILNGRVYDVTERRNSVGIQKGDLIDARIFKADGKLSFTDAFWVHPSKAKEFILKEVENFKGRPRHQYESFLFDLSYLRLKSERFKHVSIEDIYSRSQLLRDKPDSWIGRMNKEGQ